MAEGGIAITGVGAVSAFGLGVDAFVEGAFSGRSCAATIRAYDALERRANGGPKTTIACEVDDPLESQFARRELSQLDRFTRLAVIAAREAMGGTGLPLSADQPSARAGVYWGSGVGGQTTQESGHRDILERGRKRLHPFTVPRLIPSAAPAKISSEFGLQGPTLSVSTACASSLHALSMACDALLAGRADVMLVGGSDAVVCEISLISWDGVQVTAREACRPFSIERDGMVLGEGGAAMVLEREEDARARGAKIHAVILGTALGSDAGHPVMPDAAGMARTLRGALDNARVPADSIGYVQAHGTGTVANDRTESAAMRDVWGEQMDALPLSSVKGAIGHTLGAAGAFGVLAAVAAMDRQALPPTVGWIGPDPECPVDCVPNEARDHAFERAMVNAFGFGGFNASLVLARP